MLSRYIVTPGKTQSSEYTLLLEPQGAVFWFYLKMYSDAYASDLETYNSA